MTIRAKITALALALLALLALVGGIAVDGLWRVQEELRSLHRDVIPLDTMIETLAQQEIEREADLYAALRSSAGGRVDVSVIAPMLAKEAEAVTALMATITAHEEEVGHDGIAARLDEPRAALVVAGTAFAEAARVLSRDLSTDRPESEVNAAFDDLVARGAAMRASLDAISAAMRQVVADAVERAERHEALVLYLLLAVAVAALLVGMIGAVVISGRITRPIERLVSAAREVERGVLDVEVPVEGTDEMAGLGRTFNGMVEGLRVKERIKETFGKYIDPRIVEGLIGESSRLDSSRRAMTVSLARYDGFAEFAEGRTPERIVDRINAFYAAMSGAVAARNGVVDKMASDSVLTFFGPPFTPEDNHAELACLAAIEQARWRPADQGESGDDEHRPRIVIASDVSIVGNMGSEHIRSFTIMGDNMALAEVMMAVSEEYEAGILISGATKASLGWEIATRHVDTALLPGRVAPVELHEVLGRADEVSEGDLAFARRYEEALAVYASRDFERARALFEGYAEEWPDDAPTFVLRQRLEMIEIDPPSDDWGGAWRLTGT